jgi:hypothetical protein
VAKCSFLKYQAIPLSKTPAKVLVRWEVALEGSALADVEFYIDRAIGQDARPGFQHVDIHGKPMEDKNQFLDSKNLVQQALPISGLENHWYLDFSPELANLTLPLYYRIRARQVSTQEEWSTPMFGFSGELDLVGLYVVDEHNFLLEDVTGTPCFVYNRRRGGKPCSKCFDPVQKKRLISNCKLCYGTNWEGGFYRPIDTYVDFNPNPKNVQVAQWGETQQNETNILMSNFPQVSPGDVIHEIREGRVWRVVQVNETEKRRVPMLQFARVSEVKPSDPEYSLPFDERFAIAKVQELEATKKKREF